MAGRESRAGATGVANGSDDVINGPGEHTKSCNRKLSTWALLLHTPRAADVTSCQANWGSPLCSAPAPATCLPSPFAVPLTWWRKTSINRFPWFFNRIAETTKQRAATNCGKWVYRSSPRGDGRGERVYWGGRVPRANSPNQLCNWQSKGKRVRGALST